MHAIETWIDERVLNGGGIYQKDLLSLEVLLIQAACIGKCPFKVRDRNVSSTVPYETLMTIMLMMNMKSTIIEFMGRITNLRRNN